MQTPDDRRESAAFRQEGWDKLTTAEKIADLDLRLGEGVGAEKQRARLQAQLEEEGKKAKGKKK